MLNMNSVLIEKQHGYLLSHHSPPAMNKTSNPKPKSKRFHVETL